jgi:hypothetical protein
MGSYRASRMRQVRNAQLFALHPVDLAATIRVMRRLQLQLLRREADRRDRSANDNDAGGSGPVLIGQLIAALGFEAEEDHPLETAVGLGAAAYRCNVGIDQ